MNTSQSISVCISSPQNINITSLDGLKSRLLESHVYITLIEFLIIVHREC